MFFNKLNRVFFFLCVCSFIDDKLLNNMVKVSVNHELQTSGSAVNFDNVMIKFTPNKRSDTQKTDSNLFFSYTAGGHAKPNHMGEAMPSPTTQPDLY